MRPELRRVFWIGLGLLSAQMAWVVYNTFVPNFLQAGAPDFDTHSSARSLGFGLSAAWTGVIMTLDNLAAFFIQPLMGPLSDRTATRWGRRLPYLLLCMPLAAVGLALIPMAPMGSLPASNGFALFMAALLLMVLAMAAWRTPLFALMADITPSPLRSHANGLMNLMAGIGGIIAFILGSALYKLYAPLPFWVVGGLMLAALGLIVWRVREPPKPATVQPEAITLPALLNSWRALPKEHRRPLTLLALAVFLYMLGFHPIEAFFSSYGVNVLGLPIADTGLVLSSAYITFILFAVPSGMLAARIGRKRTMQAGLLLFATVMLVAFFTPVTAVIIALLALGGLAWALIDINGLPMILDVTRSTTQTGAYAGVYFAATTLAATVGPIVNGVLIDLTRRNYNVIFLIGPVFFALSFVALFGVHHGEAHQANTA